MSDRTRLRLLNLLLDGELCVCDLVDTLALPQPTASRHLGILRDAGLVVSRKQGLWRYYRLADAKEPVTKHLIGGLRIYRESDAGLAGDIARLAEVRKTGGCCDGAC